MNNLTQLGAIGWILRDRRGEVCRAGGRLQKSHTESSQIPPAALTCWLVVLICEYVDKKVAAWSKTSQPTTSPSLLSSPLPW